MNAQQRHKTVGGRLRGWARLGLLPAGLLAGLPGGLSPGLVYGQAATQPADEGPRSPLDGTEIGELEIRGLQRIDESYIRNQMRVRPGTPYRQRELQDDVGRLLRTGRFRDVEPQVALVEGTVRIVLTIAEKPEVASITFEGATEFDDKDLLEVLTFGAGDPLDAFDVGQGREAIERLYREKGYAYVEVTTDEEAVRAEQRVVYRIVENQRVRVKHVRFEGTTALTDRELAGQIETKKHLPIFRTGDFDPERAAHDSGVLQKYYRDRGWLDAEVSYVPEFEDVAREKLTVIFRVNEGTRYTIQEVKLEGFSVFEEADLLGSMQLKVSDPLLESRREADRKDLETLYGSNGYIDARVEIDWVFSAEPGQVVVTVRFTEGEQWKVGWIEVDGNFHTQEKCVRRELRFFPEEIIDVSELREAERRLKGTGLFSEAKITPLGDGDPGSRDVRVVVTENERTNQFIAGAALGSDAGLMGNIVLENTNFDITDWPRSWGEFFRGRAFRGAGQTMRIQLEPGTELTQFRIDFREPYFLDKPIGFNIGAYVFERGRDGYDEQRAGGHVSFDRRFEEGWLAGWTGEVALRSEIVRVADRESFAAEDIRDVEGSNFLTSVKGTLLHDTTDSRFDPSRGHRATLSWEQVGLLGGDFFFSNLNARYTQHWTVAIDEEDRKSVVSARARAGQILGDAPVFERYYAGGIGSMRGFDYRGISPRDGLRNNRVGGDFSLLTGAEYSFPLYAKVVRGVFFLDMGTVEENLGITEWRAAVGSGVRLTLDIFGTVPMEFDLAVPISEGEDDNTRIFSFFIGLPFF